MYETIIVDMIKKLTQREVLITDYDKDIRKLGVDSIMFIGVLAEIEEALNVDFGYGMLDNHPIISVNVLNDTVKSLKEQKP